jgi:hypothetical protein
MNPDSFFYFFDELMRTIIDTVSQGEQYVIIRAVTAAFKAHRVVLSIIYCSVIKLS